MVRPQWKTVCWIVALVPTCLFAGHSDGLPGNWTADFDEAVEKAGRVNKDIFLLCTGLEWERVSQQLYNDLFSKAEFARELAKDFVLAHIDLPEQPKAKEQASEFELKQYQLVRKFYVSRVPVYYLCTSDGRPYHAHGFESEGVEANLQRIRSRKKTFDDTMANIENAQGPERAKRLEAWLQTIPGPIQNLFVDVKEEIVKLDPDNTTGLWYKYKLQLLRPKATEARLHARLQEAETLFLQIIKELELEGEDLQSVLYELADVYYQQKDFPKLLKCIQRAKEAAPNSNRISTLNEMEEVFIRQWEEQKRQNNNASETRPSSPISSTEKCHGVKQPNPPTQGGSEFVLVKGGTFINTKSNYYGKSITLSDFYMGRYEVTQKQWREVMESNPSQFKGDHLPVETVSWYDCIEYCNKRSRKEGLKPYYTINKHKKDPDNENERDDIKWWVTINANADGYRLPTEAQWEYAAGGGRMSKSYTYSGSNHIDEVAWYWKNAGDEYLSGAWHWTTIENNHNQTKPVGLKKSNELGLYDMSGNVREWCWDWHEDVEGNNGSGRVWRGGGWIGGAHACVTSYRGKFDANGKGADTGFRVCRSKPTPGPAVNGKPEPNIPDAASD